jgi:hypothetical protein
MRQIAALYVQTDGSYYGLPGVDPWDEQRNAMLYDGPHPVVAHPPCERWSVLAGLVEHVHGYKRGDDGGTFAHALAAVRKFGGVLEHPAHSAAWLAHGITKPVSGGGWQCADFDGGWSCYVEQGRYGHAARKATWLYSVGCDLPSLRWGLGDPSAYSATVSRAQVSPNAPRKKKTDKRRTSSAEASKTPQTFRDILIAMARSARAGE